MCIFGTFVKNQVAVHLSCSLKCIPVLVNYRILVRQACSISSFCKEDNMEKLSDVPETTQIFGSRSQKTDLIFMSCYYIPHLFSFYLLLAFVLLKAVPSFSCLVFTVSLDPYKVSLLSVCLHTCLRLY